MRNHMDPDNDMGCVNDQHAPGCPCRAGGDAVLAPFVCNCGTTRYRTEAESNPRIETAYGSFPKRCPVCNSNSDDHEFNGDDFSDWRCFDCDGRYHSHGGSPDSWMVVRDSDGEVVRSQRVGLNTDAIDLFIGKFENETPAGHVFAYTDCPTCEGTGIDEDRTCKRCFERRAPVVA